MQRGVWGCANAKTVIKGADLDRHVAKNVDRKAKRRSMLVFCEASTIAVASFFPETRESLTGIQ